MPTLKIKVATRSWTKSSVANVMLDTGASRSFVSQTFCKRLGSSLLHKNVNTYTVKGINGVFKTAELASLILLDENAVGFQLDALVLPAIGKVGKADITLSEKLAAKVAEEFPTVEREIDILIGNDYLWFIIRSVCAQIMPGIVAISTIFGKVLAGYIDPNVAHSQVIANLALHLMHPWEHYDDSDITGIAMISTSDTPLGDLLLKGEVEKTIPESKDSSSLDEIDMACLETRMLKYLGYESLGVEPYVEGNNHKKSDELALESLHNSLTFNNGVYECGLTHNPAAKDLLNNRKAAMALFLKKEEFLISKPDIRKQYNATMALYESEGDVELCTRPAVAGKVFYLPHSAVIKETSTTSKCRVVFNASAKGRNGVSLNDCLLAGPPGNTDLLKILLNFRWRKVAISGDVRRMYLAIGIREEDRDYLRYLWREDSGMQIKEMRFKKVAFGISDSAFTSQEVFKTHALKYADKYPEVVDSIVNDRWVDDLLNSCDTEAQAKDYVKIVTQIMSEGGFMLKKWVSSSKAVMASIPKEDRLDVDKQFTFESEDDEDVKALGVRVLLSSDDITYKGNSTIPSVVTKKVIASKVASIFDPIGLLLPFTIVGKRIMQQVWIEEKVLRDADKASGMSNKQIDKLRKQSWKLPVSAVTTTRFKDWVSQVPDLADFRTPRCVILKDQQVVRQELHVFSDASLYAYGASVMVRTSYRNGGVTMRLLVAKSRVAPSENETMPRQELMAALLGVKLMAKVSISVDKEHKLRRIHWVDSSCVLAWIKGDPYSYKVWVSNRLMQIHAEANAADFRHISGVDNPADWCTRGVTAKELCRAKSWFEGPSWILKKESLWPESAVVDTSDDLILEKVLGYTANVNLDKDYLLTLANGINDFRIVVNFVDWVRRCKPGNSPMFQSDDNHKYFTWVFIIKHFQYISFSAEIDALNRGDEIPKGSSLVTVDPFLDEEGLLRAKGRFQKPLENGYQVILKHDSRLTTLIVWSVHARHAHQGPEWVLNYVFNTYWFSKGRRTIKSIINKCFKCQKVKGKHCMQKMADIPEFRMELEPIPFSFTGVDFAGPLFAKDTKTNTEVKFWVALFTCMQMRAVHLEVVRDMTTETFLLALRRFIARRGTPKVMMSDNGKTFKKAAKEVAKLNKICDVREVQNFLRGHDIKWKFNVEAAPWWGATWERLVRTIKASLKHSLNKADLTEDELSTFIIEAEAFANSRPLADVSADPSDPLPVTPAQLLYGYDPVVESMSKIGDAMASLKLDVAWKKRLHMKRMFNKKFQKDYLQALMPRKKWLQEQGKLPIVGDLVLIDEPLKRALWPMARIVELHQGRDGLIRSAVLKTAKGVLRRPIQRLIPLEANDPLEKALC